MHICSAGTTETLLAKNVLMCGGILSLSIYVASVSAWCVLGSQMPQGWISFRLCCDMTVWRVGQSITCVESDSGVTSWHYKRDEYWKAYPGKAHTVWKAPSGHSWHEEQQILPVRPTTCWPVSGTSSTRRGPLWSVRLAEYCTWKNEQEHVNIVYA